jgi:hypothetical protein
MRPHRFLVDVGTPAGPGGHDQFAILDHRRVRHQIILPGHIVDIDFHDAEVGHGGAEVALIRVDMWP